MENGKVKNISTTQIMDLYKSMHPSLTIATPWQLALKQAKQLPHGNTWERVEMVMQYMTFKNETEETECSAFLINNLQEFSNIAFTDLF
jgi:hypothetical protein